MSRKKFIESQGATCINWAWSWSFINKKDKTIIFGAWDVHEEGSDTLIFSKDWECSNQGRKQPGYGQSREHLRLIEEEGYRLKTFPMKYSDANQDENGLGPAKIGGFEPVLTEKKLKRIGGDWYASDEELDISLPEEISTPELFFEGASQNIAVNKYERSAEARARCIEHYGCECKVCGFDFESVYGDIGKNFIHVHHIVPLSQIRREYKLDPIRDLVPVCPNCHAIMHRRNPPFTVDEVKRSLIL